MHAIEVASDPNVSIDATQSRWVAVRVQIPYEGAEPGSHKIKFEITARDTPSEVSEQSVFIVPR
jgi:hypothetical protein